MGFGDFWIQNGNGKEQLKDTKHGVRKEQVDKKFQNLFDAYDANNDGTLEDTELQQIFGHLKNLSGDNVLDASENKRAASIFAEQVGIQDADFQGFVKSISDASEDILSSEETATDDGGKEIKTKYKDGTTETIAYYSNGDFKWKKIEKRFAKTTYEMILDGKKQELTEEQYNQALKKLNEKPQPQQKPKATFGIEGQKRIVFPQPTPSVEVKTTTNKWEEHTQEYSPRFIAEKLGVDINTDEGKKILERISYLPKEALDQIKDGAELKDIIAQNELTPNFDNISNILEILYGVTLRNDKELEASKPQRDKIMQQIQTVNLMSELYARVAEFNDTYTDNQGLFGIGAEGIGYLLNKVGIHGENHYQWADSCREFIEKINDFKVLNPDKFEKEFKELTGKEKFNVDALQKMVELSKSGKAQDEEGNYTEEFKKAVKDFSNFDVSNPNAKAWYHPDNLMSGFGEALIMIGTLGWGAETKAGQTLAASTMTTFTKAGVAVASKQVNNRLLQGALRLSGKGVKLIGPAINEGTKMYAYTAAAGTSTNIANRAIKFDSEDNTLDKFIETEAMVLDSATGSFGFGAFAGVFGSTVTQKVMQRASRVSQKVGTALSDKFAKGAVDANEVFTTILEKSTPTKIAEVAAFATDVLGFTAFESVLAIVKNLDNFPDGYSVEDLTKVIWEELKNQGYNLGQIKIVAWLMSSRSARMQATRYMKDAMPQLRGVTVEGVNGGKDGFKINLPNGRKVECKNTTEYISALHLMVRGETAFGKNFNVSQKADVKAKTPKADVKISLGDEHRIVSTTGVSGLANRAVSDNYAYSAERVELTQKLADKGIVEVSRDKDSKFVTIKVKVDESTARLLSEMEGKDVEVEHGNSATKSLDTELVYKFKGIDSDGNAIFMLPNEGWGFAKGNNVLKAIDNIASGTKMYGRDVPSFQEFTLMQGLERANDRETFVGLRDKIKNMPVSDAKSRLMKAYTQKYNAWSSNPARPDIRMQYIPSSENPHNIVNIETADAVGAKAQQALSNSKHRIATAGYSAPPEGYETATRDFLKALDGELGTEETAYVTSPTADKGSIDAITSEVAGFKDGRLFYTTAQDYVEYINPDNFPESIDTQAYAKVPKYVLPDAASYSAATAKCSNAFLATGGRNATVSDFVNAIENGNKAIILENTSLDVPAWGEAKGRVENASKYLAEQIQAVKDGKPLPYPEIGKFTRSFIETNMSKIDKLVRLYQVDGKTESINAAASQAAKFIKSNVPATSLSAAPKITIDSPEFQAIKTELTDLYKKKKLTDEEKVRVTELEAEVQKQGILVAKSPLIEQIKISMLAKAEPREAFLPDFSNEAQLKEMGFTKKEDGKWYHSNSDWYPDALSDKDVVYVFKRDAKGKPIDTGFGPKDELPSLYVRSEDFDNNNMRFVQPSEMIPGKPISVKKCASGTFCILPVGTKLFSSEGIVEVKPGEIVNIKEAKNSIHTSKMSDVPDMYKADPLNPASKELFDLINEYKVREAKMTEPEQIKFQARIADAFGRVNRGQKLIEILGTGENAPKTLRDEYDVAARISKAIDEKYTSRIDCSDFDKGLEQASKIMDEILADKTLNAAQKQAAIMGVMTHMITSTNLHQHGKGSTPKELTLELARKKGMSQEEIAKIEAEYAHAEKGYDNLPEFNVGYDVIGKVIQTTEDYKTSIRGIVRESMKRGQLVCEIRCACDTLRDPVTGKSLEPMDGAEAIVRIMNEVADEIRAEGLTPPKMSYVILTFRGKGWDGSIPMAELQAEIAVKLSEKYPNMKFGYDVAGPESTGWGPKAFKGATDKINKHNEDVKSGKKQGNTIGITMHAGETPTYEGGEGYKSVLDAIEMGAVRIGHGIRLAEYLKEMETKNPEEFNRVLNMVKEKGITIEICGVCNILSIPENSEGMELHAIQIFLDYGIPVSLCTDNDAICGTNISKEYMQFLLTGHSNFMDWNAVKQSVRDGVEAAFIPEADKAEVRREQESRIAKVQKLLDEKMNGVVLDATNTAPSPIQPNQPIKIGVIDLFGKKKGIAFSNTKDFSHGELVAGAIQSQLKGQNVEVVPIELKATDPEGKRDRMVTTSYSMGSDSYGSKTNLYFNKKSFLKELKKLNALPKGQKFQYLNVSNIIEVPYKVNGREITPQDLADPAIREEIRKSLPEQVQHIIEELETMIEDGTEVYISAGNKRTTFNALSLAKGAHSIGGLDPKTGEPLSYFTNNALVEDFVPIPLSFTGAKGNGEIDADPTIKGVRMAGIIDQQGEFSKMSKRELRQKVATNADYAELKQHIDKILADGKRRVDINFFQYSLAFNLPEKFRYKIYDTQKFIAMFEGKVEQEVLDYIRPMGTHCDIRYKQFFDMDAKEGHHIMPMSKTTLVRNTISGTSFAPGQVIARDIKAKKK